MKTNKNIFKIQCSIYLLMLMSCAPLKHDIIPTYNKGGYTINASKKDINLNPTDIFIYGRVLDVMTKEPISNVQINIECNKTQTLSNGKYSFRVKRSVISFPYIKCISIGYKTIETEFLDFTNSNTINVDFFLMEDDRPLINCEGYN